MTEAVRLLIVDDEPMILSSLSRLLELYPEIDLVGTAAGAEEAYLLVEQLAPDLVLMDMRMPLVDGITATRHLAPQYPAMAIVMHTAYSDPAIVDKALEAGATGFVIKGSGPDNIVSTILDAARA